MNRINALPMRGWRSTAYMPQSSSCASISVGVGASVAVAILALALWGPRSAWGEEDAKALMERQRQAHAKYFEVMDRQDRELAQVFQKVKPLSIRIADSLSMDGDGLAGIRNLGGPHTGFSQNGFLVSTGTLYFNEQRDFDRWILYYHLDPTQTLAQRKKEKLDELQPYVGMKGLSPDQQQALQTSIALLAQARTPADLALVDILPAYGRGFQGPAALSPDQIRRIREAYARRFALAEELAKELAKREKAGENAAANEPLLKSYEEMNSVLKFLDDKKADFFTPAQRKAMGWDRDLNADLTRRQGVMASIIASAGGGNEDTLNKQFAEAEKKRRDEEQANRAAAPLKFTLKGKDAELAKVASVHTPEGLLWMYADILPDKSGAEFRFFLDEKKTWAVEKISLIEELKKWRTAAQQEEFKTFMETAANYSSYAWGYELSRLQSKLGSVPEDVCIRFEAMIKEDTVVVESLLKAYRGALAQAGDAQAQRTLFEAMREAVRTESKNQILSVMRSSYDPEGTRDDLPWLLSMDQVDLVNAGQLGTGSSAGSGTSGSLIIQARPAGERQYVSIQADNETLGSLAPKVQAAAREWYHNHRLKLRADPAAAEKPVRGLIEGKSCEELLQSFAQRTGTRLVKDEKDGNTWDLKL